MPNVKSAYITGLLAITAVFGLVNCDSKSKNANPVVQQQDDDGGSNGGGSGTTSGGSAEGYFDPTLIQKDGLVVKEVNYAPISSNKKAIFTGASLDQELNYTDAVNEKVNESMMQELKRGLRIEFDDNDDAMAAMKAFAKSLTLNQVIVNPTEPNDIRVNFTIKRSGKDVKYSMTGKTKNSNGTITSKLAVKSGPNDVVANIQCVDADETCHNVLVIINDKSQQSVRKAFALFRSTPVKLNYYSQAGTSDDQDDVTAFSAFNKILQNSKKNNNHRLPRLQNVVMESSSVVFGRSTFALFARIENKNGKETIMPLFGSLVRQQNDSEVNRELKDPKKVALANASKSPYDNIMKHVSRYVLLGNDGLGSIQVLMNFGADQQDGDLVVLTISRLNVQLRALND